MSDNRDVFVFISSSGCGHCTTFRNKEWPATAATLQKLGKYRYYELKDGNAKTLDTKVYPKGVLKYASSWFPFFILADGTEWNKALTSNDDEKNFVPLNKVAVMNAKPDPQKGFAFEGKYQFTKDGIIKWLSTSPLSSVENERSVIQPLVSKSETGETSLIKTKSASKSDNSEKKVVLPNAVKVATCGGIKIVSRSHNSGLS